MAEQSPLAAENQTAAASRPAKSSLMAKIAVLLFIVAVVVIECLAAWMCLPSSAVTEELAGTALRGGAQAKSAPQEEQKKEAAADQVEVDLGEFTVTAFQPVSNSTLRIAFRLYGTVATTDESEFLARMKESQHRFREQVIVTLRSADVTDLTDAGLGLLKRTILEKTNATLGKPFLKMVIFSDFSFVEM